MATGIGSTLVNGGGDPTRVLHGVITGVGRVAGRPVYLAMAMDGERRLRLKPQNLLVNLPIRSPE